MKCFWCKGNGRLSLANYGTISCLNCHGTGEGSDGGNAPISSAKKPWAAKNFRRKNENTDSR